MVSILLVAHAPLASALQAAARHVYPDCGATLGAVDVDAGASREAVEADIRAAVAARRSGAEDEVLILADVFGATPCNAAQAAVDGARVRLVAGVNVPMLWRVLCYADRPIDDLIARALSGATQGVMHVAVPRRQNQPRPPGAHDPDDHHDQ